MVNELTHFSKIFPLISNYENIGNNSDCVTLSSIVNFNTKSKMKNRYICLNNIDNSLYLVTYC